MKTLGKPIFVLIALLILVFSVLSVSGYSYYTGDLKNTVFKGFADLDWGNDVAGGTEVSLIPASADEIDTVKDVIRKRAAYFGLSEYELYSNSKGEVVLVVPNDIDADFDASEVAAFLTCNGEFTLRPGLCYSDMHIDSANNAVYSIPTDETKLLTTDHIKTASYSEYTEAGVTYNFVEVKFGAEGTELLSQITNPDTGAYYNQTISAWVDDRMFGYQTMSNQVVSGIFSFTYDGMSDSTARLVASVIKSGTMPCELSLSYHALTPPTAGTNVSDIITYTGLSALLIIAFVMIYKYKTGGVVTLLALFMQFSGILAILTGFVGQGHTFMMTIPGVCALGLSVLLTVFSCSLICESTRKSLGSGNVLSKALESAYTENKSKILDVSVILALVSLVALFVFGESKMNVSFFGTAAASGIHKFSYVLLLGSVLNIINGYILPKLMFRSLLSYKALNKASMFGGAVNEK